MKSPEGDFCKVTSKNPEATIPFFLGKNENLFHVTGISSRLSNLSCGQIDTIFIAHVIIPYIMPGFLSGDQRSVFRK